MYKALIIIPDNNKGRFITKGFSRCFKEFSFFTFEKKIYDLNPDEINKMNPDIIFIFWSGISQKEIILDFFNKYTKNSKILNCSELKKDIPEIFYEKQNSYCFYSDSGSKNNMYIPCINPKDYKTKFSGYKYTITFAGNPAFLTREKILSSLLYQYGHINIFCRSYDFYKSLDDMYKNKIMNDEYIDLYKNCYKGYIDSQLELSQIYSSSKINLDMENDNKKEINYRCMEILVSGGFLIAPYTKKLIKYFDDGCDLETYTSIDNLIDKINFYLKNLNIAKLISARGRKNVVNNFSFYDRLKTMLKVVYGKNISN